jgi:hypothetical protein
MATDLPNQPYVTLSEALSWIAFSEWSGRGANWENYTDAKQRLELGLINFLQLATAGTLRVRGKLMPNADTDPDAIDTADILETRFHDFRQYDQNCCGLRVGTGLLGFAEERDGSFHYIHLPLARQEFYRDVLVGSDNLILAFPSLSKAPAATHADAVNWCQVWASSGRGTDGNKAWKEFTKQPQFEGWSRDDCFRPAWNEKKTKNKQ